MYCILLRSRESCRRVVIVVFGFRALVYFNRERENYLDYYCEVQYDDVRDVTSRTEKSALI